MIEVRELSVEREKREILHGISFHLKKGTRTALLGANGAGKSTLLLTLAGAYPILKGTGNIAGLSLNKQNLPQLRQKIGLLFQDPDDQLFLATVQEDIAFGPRNLHLSESEIQQRIVAIAETLHITPLLSRSASRLSGGEKRLVALASLLVMEPELLLLDEPGTFLDPRSRRNLICLLAQLPQTMLIATHDFALAEALCSQVILLKEGRIFAQGDISLLTNQTLLEEAGL